MTQLAARFPFDPKWEKMKIKPPREMLADDIGEYLAQPCCGFRGPEGRHEHARDCDHFWWDGQPRYTGPI